MGSCLDKDVDDADSNEIDLTGGNVRVVTSKEEWDEKISEANQSGKKVVANFSATWCDPCKIICPFYVELSQKYPSLVFLMVDVDQLTDFCSSLDIRATPTFFFLKDGKEQLDKLVGANKSDLINKIAVLADSTQYSPPNLSSQ